MENISASVRVTLQVDVYVGNWSGKESFEGLREQAIREAKQKLSNTLAKQGGEMKVVGEPLAMHVIMKGEKSDV